MALLKIKDFDPNYKETFGGNDFKGLDIYSDINNEKIGSVHDLLVDEHGHFRYFIIDLGFWGFGKKVLIPVGRVQIDNDGKHMRALGFTKEQAENMPEFNDSLKIDHDYEERVRGNYRQPMAQPVTHHVRPLEEPIPARSYQVPPAPSQPQPMPPQAGYPPNVAPDVDRTQPAMGQPYPPSQQAPLPGMSAQAQPLPAPGQAGYSTGVPMYNYQQDPDLYGMNEQNHSILQRYEQRLMAKKNQAGQTR